MTLKFPGALVAILAVIATASPAHAANKEHQQLMADLRMLQEQSQQLQNLIGTVTDTLKAVNTRLDQQAETNRRAFADQKLVIDNLTNDVRVIREKLDDNNVRIGSLTQEVDSLRQSMQQLSARPSGPSDPDGAAAGSPSGTGGASPGGGSPTSSSVGVSPQKLLDTAKADYSAGQYDLAVIGFNEYIRSFPKSDMADDAQVNICNAYYQDAKYQQAVDACDLAIRLYPTGDKLPEAYYRKGLALSNLKDVNAARAMWEDLVKRFPKSDEASLAMQGLERLKRP